MEQQVLCKDCKHSFRQFGDWLAYGSASIAFSCRKTYKPKHNEPDPVLGSRVVKAKYDTCSVARIGTPGRDHGRCGESGLWWEPKNKRDLFKYIKHVGAVQ